MLARILVVNGNCQTIVGVLHNKATKCSYTCIQRFTVGRIQAGEINPMSKSRHPLVVPLLAGLLLLPLLMPVVGQQQIEPFRGNPFPSHPRPFTDGDWPGEYTFVRIVYDSPHSPYNRWFGGAWLVDYPEADYNFMMGIREWAGSKLFLSGR